MHTNACMYRLVPRLICTEGQDRGDEEEGQDGATPGGISVHMQRGTATVPEVCGVSHAPLPHLGGQAAGATQHGGMEVKQIVVVKNMLMWPKLGLICMVLVTL